MKNYTARDPNLSLELNWIERSLGYPTGLHQHLGNKSQEENGNHEETHGNQVGTNRKFLTQVYTGEMRSHLEIGATSIASAAKSNTAKLDKIQNSSLS